MNLKTAHLNYKNQIELSEYGTVSFDNKIYLGVYEGNSNEIKLKILENAKKGIFNDSVKILINFAAQKPMEI